MYEDSGGYSGNGPLTRWGWAPRIVLAAAAWALWTYDVNGENAGLWIRPEWALALGGLWLGLGIGLVVYGTLDRLGRSNGRMV